jgi:Tfp pilus assembly protein PilV
MKTRNPAISGFSLVEVTVALGVIVFCLVTIMGVLAVGINSTHVSTVQTSATNILTAVASDLEATPNITPSYPGPKAKGTLLGTSVIFGIKIPAGGTGTVAAQQTVYIGENGQVVASAALALYQLNVWITSSNTTTAAKQETFARLLLTWPPATAYANAPGYVENIVAINRT